MDMLVTDSVAYLQETQLQIPLLTCTMMSKGFVLLGSGYKRW